MPTDFPFHMAPLADQDRSTFTCGVAALDDYIRHHASQDVKKRIAACFVLLDETNNNRVAGYYSLAATGIRADDAPPELARKLPKYPMIPATLIGRLASDQRYRGRGLGEYLLMDALLKSAVAAKDIGSIAVVVDAKSDQAAWFYRKYGFIQFPAQPERLFIPMKTVEGLF